MRIKTTMIMEIGMTIEMTKAKILGMTTVETVLELSYKTKTVLKTIFTTIMEITTKTAKTQTTGKRITTGLLESIEMITRMMEMTKTTMIKEINFYINYKIFYNFLNISTILVYQYIVFNDRDYQANAIAKAKMTMIFKENISNFITKFY